MPHPTLSIVELLTGPNLAALLTLPGIGEKRAVLLGQQFGTWDRLLTATTDELVETLGSAVGRQLSEHRPSAPISAALPPRTAVVSMFDDQYPARLRDLQDPPPLLWWSGTLPSAETKMVAIVGTRTPNQFGAAVASLAADTAAQHGLPTCSGLALGVDSIAQTACLNARQPTWAVLGQGIDTLPTSGDRARLAARILREGGGLLSEVPPGTQVAAHLLTKRNRLQSGLSAAVFIAQTGLADGSKPAGTLHTVRYALAQRRYLAVAVPPAHLGTDPAIAGNTALTHPDGIDPGLLHITDADLADFVRTRTPAADLCVSGAEDLTSLWQRMDTWERS